MLLCTFARRCRVSLKLLLANVVQLLATALRLRSSIDRVAVPLLDTLENLALMISSRGALR